MLVTLYRMHVLIDHYTALLNHGATTGTNRIAQPAMPAKT